MSDLEPSVKIQDKDHKSDRRQSEDKVRIDTLYSAVFFWCRALGLHAVTKNKHGDYVVSTLSFAPGIIMSVFILVCLGVVVWELTTSLPFWFAVVLASSACGHSFCLYASVHTYWNARRMKRYLAAFPGVKAQRDSWANRAVAGAVFYPLLASICAYVLLPEWKWASPNIFVTSAVPGLLDTLMTCFSRALQKTLNDLRLEVTRRDSWRSEDVCGMSRRWVVLTELLQEHNEVSDAPASLPSWLLRGKRPSFTDFFSLLCRHNHHHLHHRHQWFTSSPLNELNSLGSHVALW